MEAKPVAVSFAKIEEARNQVFAVPARQLGGSDRLWQTDGRALIDVQNVIQG